MRRACVVAALVVGLAGCGHGKPAISNDAAKALQAKVAQIRASASAHDAAAVAAELAALRAQVAVLRQGDQLSAAAAQKILDAATAVDQNLSLITTTTTTTTTTTKPPPDHGHGKDKAGG